MDGKKEKYLLFIVWAYYVITLFPVLGIGVAWISEKGSLFKRNSVLGGLGVTFICIFILLGQMTIRQIKIWHNPVTFWSYAISVFPFPTNDPIAHYNLGVGYDERGRLDEAISEYAQALIINPNYVMAHLNLGIAFRKKGMLDEAISEHKKVLAIKPNHPKAHNNLSVAYYYKGNYKLAILHCDKALELNCPVNPKYLALLEPYRARKTP